LNITTYSQSKHQGLHFDYTNRRYRPKPTAGTPDPIAVWLAAGGLCSRHRISPPNGWEKPGRRHGRASCRQKGRTTEAELQMVPTL